MSAIGLLVALLAAAGVFLLIRALFVPAQSDAEMLETRLAQFNEAGRNISSLTEAEMSLPFFERVVRPFLDAFGKILSRGKKPGDPTGSDALQERLNSAGRPWGLTAQGFQALRIMCVVILVLIGAVVGLVVSLGGVGIIVFPVVGLMLGYIGPGIAVDRKGKKRKKEMLLGLPSALDLLTISVEAGLGFDAALARVTDKYKNALAQEFNQVLNEIRLGRPRLEALSDMGRRSGVEEVNNFVQAVVQSEQLGVGIANVLRIQSEEIRRRRRQRAEEAGAKAPMKMLFPMVGCIFPTLFIVLLGPAALQVAASFGGGSGS